MTATEWIEEFTGLKVPGGEPTGKDLAAEADALEAEAAQKQQLLTDARQVVASVKADFQKAMQLEVKTKGSYFKQKLLEVKGTQTDEADFTELDFQSLKLSPGTETAIAKGKNTIINQNERLKAAEVERAGKKEPLFTQEEIQEEYWFPLVRERILPETFVADIYSKTQHMLDETNALYEKGVADKKKKGKLTPKTNRLREAMDTSADLLAVGSDLGLTFGKGTVDAKRAAEVLNLLSEGIRTGGKVYDKAKEKEFSDAASMALDNISLLAEIILTQKGAPPNTIAAVKSGFKAGGAAIATGKAFASGEEGVPKGLDSLMDVLRASLEAAAVVTDDPEKKKRLQIAAATAPALLKNVALGMDIAKKVEEGDADGVVDCLTKAAKNALGTIQDIKKIETTSGLSKETAKKKGADIDKQTTDITQDINLANFGVKTLIAAKTLSKKGEHLKAINKIIQSVGKGLADTLEKAGLDKKQASQIAGIYNSASSAPAILEMLCNDPPDVPGAMNALGAGIESSFKTAAPNNKDLLQAGAGLKQGIAGLATGIQIKTFYDNGEYDKGIETFAKTVQSQVQGVFDIKDIKTADELAAEAARAAPAATPAPESLTDKAGRLSTKTTAENRARQKEKDEKARQKKELDLGAAPVASTAPPDPAAPTNEKLKNLVGDIQKIAQKANKEMAAALEVVAKVEAELQKVEDATAAEEILKEAVSDLTEFSEAEAAGIESSKIDKLIAKIEKDRILWNVAIQIAEGGAAFAATFVPALGVPGMVARLAANMVAAGQRLQQYSRWSANQKDFEAAQDALASSSKNFVKNQGGQAIYYTMQSLFKAAEITGNVLKLAGVAGPAAAGLEAVAKASSKAAEIIRKRKQNAELEAAWKITQMAFKNPGNRKLGLKARALNPTLAKYSIAWGAVIKNDPLARNALSACQLTDAALADESANVDKVVNYLERFYEDDDRLYRELEELADWLPKDIELTLRSWAKLKQIAVKYGKLRNPDTGNIDGLLSQLKESDKLATLDQAGIGIRIQTLEDLNKALEGYQPKMAKPKDAEAVKKACALLQKQASQALAEAKDRAAVLAAEAKRLAGQTDALGELNAQMAKVEDCQHTDDLADLQVVHTGAQIAIKHIRARETTKADVAIQSHLKQLEEKLEPLGRLIAKMEQEEAALEAAA